MGTGDQRGKFHKRKRKRVVVGGDKKNKNLKRRKRVQYTGENAEEVDKLLGEAYVLHLSGQTSGDHDDDTDMLGGDDRSLEEVLTYRNYSCSKAKSYSKPNWDVPLKQGQKRNVK